jgi:hypothetical protein
MRQHNSLLSILPFLCGILMLAGESSRARNADALHSFYVVTHFFSDFLSDSYDEILEVTSEGKDVRVRVIRISSATRYCGGQLVRAAERVLPDTTIKKLTGRVDLCSYTGHDVTAALNAAAPKGITDTWDSATLSIVAKCRAQERVLDFPYPAQVDLKALQRDNPRVRALWDLNYKVRSRAFGKRFSFRDLSAAQEKEFEDLGTKLLPELVSGQFDAGFGNYTCANQKCDTNYLAWLLRGYTGPPANRDPAYVEIINTSLRLAKYDLPKYPPIAKTAHLFGEVRLRIVPEMQTGLVKDVQLVSGNPLLGSVAINAAKKWQFSSGLQSDQPVEVVLKFHLCPDE